MRTVPFPGSIEIGKPVDMTDEQCTSAHAAYGNLETGHPFFLQHIMPNKEDIEAIQAGRGFWVQIIQPRLSPMAMWTLDEEGKANI